MLGVLKVIFYSAFIHCANLSSRVIATLYLLHNNQPAWTVGIVVSLYSFIPSLLGVYAGKWIDRIGVRIPILLGSFLVGVGCLLPVLLPISQYGIWPLCITATFAGTGFLLNQISTQGLIGILTTKKTRATGYAFQAMSFSVSAAIGPVIAGYMINQGSHDWAFILACGYVVVGIVIYLIEANGLPKFCDNGEITSNDGNNSTLQLLRLPSLRNVLIASAMVSMAWDLQSFMIPVYGTEIGLDAVAVGWLLSTFSICTFTVRVFTPLVTKLFDEWRIIISVIALSGAIFLIFPFVKALPALFVLVGLLGLILGLSQPNVLALLHQVAPDGRYAEAIGIRTVIVNASHTVYPILFGAGGSIVGAAVAFWVLGATMLGGDAYLGKSVKKYSAAAEG